MEVEEPLDDEEVIPEPIEEVADAGASTGEASSPSSAMETDDDGPPKPEVETEALPAHHQLALLLNEALPNCYNRDRVDDFCVQFCHHNSKSARKRLVAALYGVPRQSLDLLPNYARIVGTLDKVMKDIAPALVEELQVRDP